MRAQCSDRDALECLLRSVQPSVHRYLFGLVGARHADDVLQEVLILVCRKLAGLQTPELFRPWVFRIASRVAFRHLKKESRWQEWTPDDSAWFEEVPAPAAQLPLEMLKDLLAMDGIPPASRAVLALHFQQELSLTEVAAILEIPFCTVKSRLAAGLTALRNRFGKNRSM